jgi:hypothetical protein
MIELLLCVAVVGLTIHCYFVHRETKRSHAELWKRVEKVEEGVRVLLGVTPL